MATPPPLLIIASPEAGFGVGGWGLRPLWRPPPHSLTDFLLARSAAGSMRHAHVNAPLVNDTELIQRGEGLFTEGRWRKQSIAEILALKTPPRRAQPLFLLSRSNPPTEGGGRENSYQKTSECIVLWRGSEIY